MTAGMQSTPRGTLKVNVPVSFGVLHVAPALDGLLRAYPDLHVDMTFKDRNVQLVEEGYDVILVIAAEPRATLVARKLAPIRQALCASPDYVAKRGTPASIADLAAHDCIVYSRTGPEHCWHFEGVDGHASVEVNGSLRLDNENAVRQAALAGCGIALLPTYIVGNDLQRGALCPVLPAYRTPQTALYATYLPNRYVAAKVRVFVDYLITRFGPTPEWDVFDAAAEMRLPPRAQVPGTAILHAAGNGAR